jgi:hypothetical protein
VRLPSRPRAELAELPELPELGDLARIVDELGSLARCEVLARPRTAAGHALPVLALTVGDAPRGAPVLVFCGGVHGLERIGTQVVLAQLTTLARQLAWDTVLQATLAAVRLAFVPLINPVGMATRTRANGNGVDLMRNAPAHPDSWPTPLVGGQRLSPRLPWYIGRAGDPMEEELAGLDAFLRREVFAAPVALVVDVHSGFGLVDRVWFPYARTRRPFHHLPEVFALGRLLDRTLPNHVYRLEPQAQTYTIQGDFWDYVYDAYRQARPDGVMLPLTLELGSWLWVKKNPRQLLSPLGSFNPMKPHRQRRILRRHLPLFELLVRAVASPAAWIAAGAEREALSEAAFRRWYGG